MPQEPDQADHHRAHRADDHRRLDLPPERFPPPHELDLARGQASHDHGHGLKPRVAGDRLDHRHEGGEQDDLAQRLVEEVDDHARHHLDQQGQEHPGQAQHGDLTRRAALELGRVRARHPEDVFRRLLLDDVDDVVHRDRADQAVLIVDNGDGDEVVLGHEAGDLFLVHGRVHAHHVFFQDAQDQASRIREEEPPQRDASDEVPVIVDGIDAEGALFGDGLPDVLDRLLDRRGLPDRDDVGGHEASRRVFGILEDLLDLLGLLVLHEVQDLLGVLRGQLVHDVGGMLRRHAVEDQRDLDVVQGADELQERGVVQLGEDIARLVRPK